MKAFPKEIEIKTLKTRHIGVESELEVRGDMVKIEEEISKRGLCQGVGHDGGGREFRTNPISIRSLNQVRGFKYFTEYYGILKANTAVITSGGTHIHISILNTDHENMESNATAMGITFYKQFQKISGRDSFWADKRGERTLQEVRDRFSARKDRYGGQRIYPRGGMLSGTHHQTLEFRGPKGSNDCEEILAWIEFINNVVKVSNRKSIEGVQFKQLLKGERIEAYVKSLKGRRKLSNKELNQKFNGEKLC